MRQIVKTEIIYYKTPKDFEYEFNLGGVCQMRLLSQVTETRKDFLFSLAKAVTRSKIILIISEIDDVLINTLTSATGYSKEPLDYATYGIKKSSIKEIIKSAVPLVSSNGTLGGMIFEKSQQSLIILTNEKPIRNDIMTAYVNPFIKDVSEFTPSDNDSESLENQPENTETLPDTPDIIPSVTETEILQNNESVVLPEEVAQEENEAEEYDEYDEYEKYDEIPQEETVIPKSEETSAEQTVTEEKPEISDVPNLVSEDEDDNAPTTATLNLHELPSYVMDFDGDENEDEDNPEIEKVKIKKERKPLSITAIFFLIIICFLVTFIGYTFIIDPILNGKSIVENFQYYWSILF